MYTHLLFQNSRDVRATSGQSVSGLSHFHLFYFRFLFSLALGSRTCVSVTPSRVASTGVSIHSWFSLQVHMLTHPL